MGSNIKGLQDSMSIRKNAVKYMQEEVKTE